MSLSVFVTGCSSSEESANKLFVKATQLVQKGGDAEPKSYVEASEYYEAALAKLEKIVSSYASTPVAVRLSSGEAKVGPATFTQFKGVIVPRARLRAEAEGNPQAAAVLVAGTIREAYDKARAMSSIAEGYAKAGQLDRAASQFDQAQKVAGAIRKASRKAFALIFIAEAYEIGRASCRERV